MRNSGRINLELLAMRLNLFVTELLFNALTLPPMIHRTIDKTEDARNYHTTTAALSAEDGRRRRPPAGSGLRRVEEVVTSPNHQRIDRPLFPRPDGLCPRLTVSIVPARGAARASGQARSWAS
jgi:hypothetical protein